MQGRTQPSPVRKADYVGKTGIIKLQRALNRITRITNPKISFNNLSLGGFVELFSSVPRSENQTCASVKDFRRCHWSLISF